MGTQPYLNKEGKRIPGNTTILQNLGWKTPGLMHWAWALGMEGKNYREVRDEAAGTGTFIHACVDADLFGKYYGIPQDMPEEERCKIKSAMDAFYVWREGSRLEITGSEQPLISEMHQYGTTLDHPAKINGRRGIVEVKTADDIYADFWIQMAAQGTAWDENYPEDPVTGFHLLRIGKKDGGFSHHYKPSLDKAWEAFLHLRKLHDLKKEIK